MGWADAPVVEKPTGKAAWESAPLANQASGPNDIPGTNMAVQPKPQAPDSLMDKAKGVGEAALSLGTGIAAPFVGAAKAAMDKPPTVPGKPQGFMDRAGAAMKESVYAPRTQTGQSIVDTVGKGAEQLQALGPEFGGYGSLMRGASEAVPNAARGASAAARYVQPSVPGFAKNAISTLKGTEANAAHGEAQGAAKGALQDISKGYGAQASAKAQEASQAESVATAVQRSLDQAAERGGRPTLDVQGETVRTAISGAYDAADKTRKAETAGLYAEAEKAAAQREATGARIDVSSVTPKVQALLEKSENIPELRNKLARLIGSVTGAEEKPAVPAPLGKGAVSSKLKVPAVETPKQGLTYAELDQANKYLKDIAYSGELQGYDGITRRAALDLSKGLDKEIAKFVPEHAAAAQKYAELSTPLESLATRIGKAVTGTEGGLKGEAYSKIAAQNLPQKLFSTKDGIELVTDAIAGGKNATPAARKVARAQVDQMVEHWIMEGARSKGTGAKAAEAIRTPQMQATLQAVPNVGDKLAGQFAAEERTAALGERASATAKTSKAESEIAAKAKQKVDKALAQADVDFQYGSKKEAYDGYVKALRQSMGGDPERYRAAIALIDRAGTLQEKTDKARALAKKFVYGAAAVGAGYELKGAVQ